MEVDLDRPRSLHFPEEICSIFLLPDAVLWSLATFLIELTVPWLAGWHTRLYLVEVGAISFVGGGKGF